MLKTGFNHLSLSTFCCNSLVLAFKGTDTQTAATVIPCEVVGLQVPLGHERIIQELLYNLIPK